MLVSVTLSVSAVAETTFTVLLPAVLVDAVHPVEPVQTEGLTTNHLLFPVGSKGVLQSDTAHRFASL